MSLRSYLTLMILATIACYLGFAVVIYFFDPFAGNWLVMLFFYASLLLSLVGTFSVVGLILRLFFTKEKLVFKKVTTSFRQAIWLALLIIISLYLSKAGVLAWKNMVLLVFAFSLLELFFISYKMKPSLKI